MPQTDYRPRKRATNGRIELENLTANGFKIRCSNHVAQRNNLGIFVFSKSVTLREQFDMYLNVLCTALVFEGFERFHGEAIEVGATTHEAKDVPTGDRIGVPGFR